MVNKSERLILTLLSLLCFSEQVKICLFLGGGYLCFFFVELSLWEREGFG